MNRRASFAGHVVASMLRQTTARAPVASPASSGAAIPAIILETAQQRLGVLRVNDWQSPRDAHSIKPTAHHGRPKRHSQNIKSP